MEVRCPQRMMHDRQRWNDDTHGSLSNAPRPPRAPLPKVVCASREASLAAAPAAAAIAEGVRSSAASAQHRCSAPSHLHCRSIALQEKVSDGTEERYSWRAASQLRLSHSPIVKVELQSQTMPTRKHRYPRWF